MKIRLLFIAAFMIVSFQLQVLQTEASDLVNGIDKILAEQELDGTLIGVSIRSAETGNRLYERNGGIRMVPASNMKLFTAAAALDTLGREYRFHTKVYADGRRYGGFLKGDLYLKGEGDPTLLEKDLKKLAAAVRKSGIRWITGSIWADDSWYDSERYSADMIRADEEEAYGAAVSALAVSPDQRYTAGTVTIKVEPAKKITAAAIVQIAPRTQYVKIENHAVTVSEGGKANLRVSRDHEQNIFMVSGTIPLNSPVHMEAKAVKEPTGLALSLFCKALKEEGIKWGGRSKTGIVPNEAALIADRKSMPLSSLIVPFMKYSNNGHAEVLVKEMGKVYKGEGSWNKGLEVVQEDLSRLGVSREDVIMRDGSGMSRADLATANELSMLLYTVQKKPWFWDYIRSLPLAGAGSQLEAGTLKRRMEQTAAGGRVWAKTGTLRSVSSLSGYAAGKSGRNYVFTMLFNHFTDEKAVRRAQDRIAVLLAGQQLFH